MTLPELRALYRDNQLIEAIIEPSVQDGTWVVEFRHAKGGLVLLTDSEGEGCQYFNLDVASQSAMEVGFNQVRVEDK